ncbi:MAG: hypothetical protein KGM99_21035, partial [Burkholderiales bacterium]|nr:hypothetical protein [Burkholderiales bacterium]
MIFKNCFVAGLLLMSWCACAQAGDIDEARKLPGAGQIAGQETEWISYRNAYKQMILFEKYGKPKQFLQNRFQLVPTQHGEQMDDVRLTLVSQSLRLKLPVDPVGRALFPLLKSAYDENAELRLNRPAGTFVFRSRVSVTPRADGVYDVADLKMACDQLKDFLRFTGDTVAAAKKCIGLEFVFAKKDLDSVIAFKNAENSRQALPESKGDDTDTLLPENLKSFLFRFSDWP